MNLSGSKSRLVGSARELSLKWKETKNYWRDEEKPGVRAPVSGGTFHPCGQDGCHH